MNKSPIIKFLFFVAVVMSIASMLINVLVLFVVTSIIWFVTITLAACHADSEAERYDDDMPDGY